nr:CYTB [Donax trunculus]
MVKKMVNVLKGTFYTLPCPINLNMWWNMGSLLGVMLMVQVVSGLLLSCHYEASVLGAYNSVVHIIHDVNMGWYIRSLHSNGASFFFLIIYCHIGRGIYYHSFMMKSVWFVGVAMYMTLMMIAFLGYVLPWGQMSYWGATVITSMLTAIPVVGAEITQLVWGGFTVNDSTLKRFYVLHMYMPLVLAGLFMLHMYFLHNLGSNNPLGVEDSGDLISFHPYYSLKDYVGVVTMVSLLSGVILFTPDIFGGHENFIPADPFKTPMHIQPEWYFLFAYTILRSVPNKTGGVCAMLLSVLVLLVLPYSLKSEHLGLAFYPASQVNFWCMVSSFIGLTFLGARPVEYPYYEMGRIFMDVYFSYFITFGVLELYWDKIMAYVTFSSKVKGNGMFEVEGGLMHNGITGKSSFPTEPFSNPFLIPTPKTPEKGGFGGMKLKIIKAVKALMIFNRKGS